MFNDISSKKRQQITSNTCTRMTHNKNLVNHCGKNLFDMFTEMSTKTNTMVKLISEHRFIISKTLRNYKD